MQMRVGEPVQILREAFPEHALLGEEGGVVEGDPGSDWLWCIDPLDGTTNFAHGYPSFATSIGAMSSRIRASELAGLPTYK